MIEPVVTSTIPAKDNALPLIIHLKGNTEIVILQVFYRRLLHERPVALPAVTSLRQLR